MNMHTPQEKIAIIQPASFMDNLPQFISGIVTLWNANRYREDLYKQAMTLDNVGTLRRICSQGYISSLLFKKEIQWVYDHIKCFLLDGDISKIKQTINSTRFRLSDDRLSIAKRLHTAERNTIKLYEKILTGPNLSTDDTAILADHLQKLRDIDHNLDRELVSSYESIHTFRRIALA